MDTEIRICADLGSSLGKGSYTIENKSGWIAQENAIAEEHIKDPASDSCVIEFKGKAWTIGSSAVYGQHETALHKKKADEASLRTLGMVGKIIERESFNEGYIDLTVLLPVGERRFFEALQNNLQTGLYGATFNGIKPDIKVRKIRVLPEGSGVASQIPDESAAVLMFGHKDISLLLVKYGAVVERQSLTLTGLGMMALINECPINVSDELILAKLICKEVRTKKAFSQYFSDKEQARAAKQTLTATKVKVWQRINRELSSYAQLTDASKVYVTGGSWPVWEPELKAKFKAKLRFFKPEIERMGNVYPELNEPEYNGYKNRLTDSYLMVEGAKNA